MTTSKMTLGTVQLGLNYGINNKEGKPSLEKAFKVLNMAIDSGVNTLDTAAGYGDSEIVIGNYIKENSEKVKNLSIVTKFKLGEINRNSVKKAVYDSVEKSIKNLGVGTIDTLLMHDAKEYKLYKEEIDETISDLKSDKIIKHAGASAYCFEEIKDMIDIKQYDSFQLPINMLDQRITKSSNRKKLEKKKIFVRSVYLQGIFFKDYTTLKGNLTEVAGYVKKVQDIAKKENLSIAELALRYVNSLDYVDSLVIGCDNDKQVKENIKLLNKAAFDIKKMEEIEDMLSGTPDWIFFPWLWDEQ